MRKPRAHTLITELMSLHMGSPHCSHRKIRAERGIFWRCPHREQSVESPDLPGQVVEMGGKPHTRYITPGAEPIIATARVAVLCPWESPVELVDSGLSEEEINEKALISGSLEQAALRRQMSPFPANKSVTEHLWTIMQTDASPLSSLP